MKINFNNFNPNFSVNNTGRINQTNVNLARDWPQVINFRESFNYKDIEPKDYQRDDVDDTTELLAAIFTKLVRKILTLGLDIRHGKKKRQGEYVIEAFFVPRNKHTKTNAYIFLPINIEYNLIIKELDQTNLDNIISKYVDRVIQQTSNPELIRLITVTAHEFGHFLSYCHGNHDQDLAKGITLMHQNQVIGRDTYTSLVFIEECVAWKYGNEHLKNFGFIWWEVFEKIKINSLQSYYSRLKLAKATFSVYCRLASLDDFRKSIVSNYFVTKDQYKSL